MKKTVLALRILHCALCIPFASARTPEQAASDLFTVTNRILRLEHGEDRDDVFRYFLASGKMTPDELSSTLVLASETLAGAKNPLDANSRRFAVSALGGFGTTNALPFLERTMREGDAFWSVAAMWAAVNLSHREPAALECISGVLRDGRPGDAGFRRDVYSRVAVSLDYEKPDKTRRNALCGFLRGATAFETDAAGQLDELLCRVEPEFRDSPERLRMAVRLAEDERARGVTNGMFRALASSLRAKADAEESGGEESE